MDAYCASPAISVSAEIALPVRHPGSKATFHDSSSEAAFQLMATLSDGGRHVLLFVITFITLILIYHAPAWNNCRNHCRHFNILEII